MKKYQMVTLNEYVASLEEKDSIKVEKAEEIKAKVNKYVLSIRRAETNAKILESLLA